TVGYNFRYLGENIAYGFGTAQGVMTAWMNSPGHRANILDPNYTEIGIAVAYAADGMPYLTQFFGSPMPGNPTGPSPVTPPSTTPPPPPTPTPPPAPPTPPPATSVPPPANIVAPPSSTTPPPTGGVPVTDGFGGGASKTGQIYATGANAGSAPVVTVYNMATG